jgi:hypothetical protein
VTGIPTLFGLVEDLAVSGGIMSIFQDQVCEVIPS